MKALAFLHEYKRPSSSLKNPLKAEISELYAINGCQVDMNLTSFLNLMKVPERFDEISVVVVDYHMAGLDGLELCRRIKDRKYKIILITADEDRGLAVDELSRGTIDYYLMKNEPEFNKRLKSIVEEMQSSYFCGLSKSVVELLIDDENSVLSRVSFANFLSDFVNENKITEYYLIDSTGSHLMRDEAGQVHWMLITAIS